MIAWLTVLALPIAGWLAGRTARQARVSTPPIPAAAAVGMMSPSAIVAWFGRPFPEQLAATVVAVIAWSGPLLRGDWSVFVAFELIGATWGAILGLNAAQEPATTTATSLPPTPPPVAHPAPKPRDDSAFDEAELTFKIALRCPSCGAQLAVPACRRMAHCGFCDSDHVCVGGASRIVAVVPDAVADEAALLKTVVAHFRHVRYLELYDRRVRPLVQRAEAQTAQSGEIVLVANAGADALAAAMELEVAREADGYARKIAPRIRIDSWQRVLSPYWHRFGTVYQVAFGRNAEAEKRMEFLIATVEGSISACAAVLPAMGKLSYLKALRPLAGAPEANVPALPVAFPVESLDERVQNPAARTIGLGIRPIAARTTFIPEIIALIYRPWHVAEIDLDGTRSSLLVDGAAAAVAGPAPALPAATPLAPGTAENEVTLTVSRCPECAGALAFAPDAVVHLCPTCFRAVSLAGRRWHILPYLHDSPAPGRTMVPFWKFPMRIRTADGELITDLPHLTDGIDGTYDQIGDTPQREQELFVPAFRTRVSKAGVRLYRTLWPVAHGAPRNLERERFRADSPPAHPVEVTLPADEAREFGRIYLALAFGPRDLARAEIKRVRARFLDAELEGDPTLTYLALPEELVGNVRHLLGRARPAALEVLESGGVRPSGIQDER